MTILQSPYVSPIDYENSNGELIKGSGGIIDPLSGWSAPRTYPTAPPVKKDTDDYYSPSTPPTNLGNGTAGGITIGSGIDYNSWSPADAPDFEGYTGGNISGRGGSGNVSGSGGGTIGGIITDKNIPTSQTARLDSIMKEPVFIFALVIIAYFMFSK